MDAFFSKEYADIISSAYRQMSQETAPKLAACPREVSTDDLMRALFEMVCLAAFLVSAQEMPKLLKAGRIAPAHKRDPQVIEHFDCGFVGRLSKELDALGVTSLREVTIAGMGEETALGDDLPQLQYGLGCPLDVATRMGEYGQLGSVSALMQRFAMRFALAFDPTMYVAMETLGMSYVEPTVRLTRSILARAFE